MSLTGSFCNDMRVKQQAKKIEKLEEEKQELKDEISLHEIEVIELINHYDMEILHLTNTDQGDTIE